MGSNRAIVVMPKYNATAILAQIYLELPFDIINNADLVDDGRNDKTRQVVVTIGIMHAINHDNNRSCGANYKTYYNRGVFGC